MNYQEIYDRLIRTRKERVLIMGVYYERHHIVPTCMGGSNELSNLVKLTAREHFLAHWLLHRIYPSNEKLGLAFWGMCIWNTKHRKFNTSSIAYEEAKKKFSAIQSARMKKQKLSDTHRKILSVRMQNVVFSSSHRKNIGENRRMTAALTTIRRKHEFLSHLKDSRSLSDSRTALKISNSLFYNWKHDVEFWEKCQTIIKQALLENE